MTKGPITTRTITDEEVEPFTNALALGFNNHKREGDAELRRPGMALDRTHAAFVDRTIVGTARSFPTRLTMPGCGTTPAGAVTNVTVLPSHRRRGALTAMMATQLDDIEARSETVAVLIASESPIYGRYGYGVATQHATLRIETARARFRDDVGVGGAAWGGGAWPDVELVEPAEMRVVAPGVHERFCRMQPGSITRNDRMWDFDFGVLVNPNDTDPRERFHIVAGEEGYASYRLTHKWDYRLPASTLVLDELVATTPEAYEALWRYCIGLDWAVEVEAHDRPPAEPLPWLLHDPRRVRVTEIADFLWVRLLDVPAALASRRYAARDRLVLEVVDEFRPATGGTFVLESDDGDATCSRSKAAPDITLSTAEVAAALLGGSPLYLPAGARRVDEHTSGAVARFDTLFANQPVPWCNTWF